MEDNDFATYFCLTVLILAGLIGGFSYKLGKMTERKALTNALVSNIEAAYWEGYTDALTGLRKHK